MIQKNIWKFHLILSYETNLFPSVTQLHFAANHYSVTDHKFQIQLSKSLRVGVSNCDDFFVTAYSQSWKMCVYVLSSLAFAPGGLLLQPTVYVHSGDQPPSTDINSGERDTTTMCECSLTVNISLAVSCPPCQHSHFKKVWSQTDFDSVGLTCQRLSALSAKICLTWGEVSKVKLVKKRVLLFTKLINDGFAFIITTN